jgi:hypothetical protein
MRTAVVVRLARCAVLATGAAIVAACSDGVLEPRATVRANAGVSGPRTAATQTVTDSVRTPPASASTNAALANPTMPWY